MFNSALKAQFEDVELGEELASCIASLASNDELTIRVIKEIAKRDRFLVKNFSSRELDEDATYGVTKEEIRKSIVTGEKSVKEGENKGKMEDTYPAIKKIDSIISFLTGATLVYYEKHRDKKKRYLFTKRALDVIAVLQERKLMPVMEDLID